MKQSNCLGIFLKNPETMPVKTRLAVSIGEKAAREVYLVMVEYLLTEFATSDCEHETQLYLAGGIPEFCSSRFQCFDQVEGDLGQKMSYYFQSTLCKAGKVLLIGSDAFYSKSEIEDAFSSLGDSDVVFQPAMDGGYTLLGMKKFVPELFLDMPWSCENLLDESIQVLDDLKVSYTLLPKKRDLDDLNDLKEMMDLASSPIKKNWKKILEQAEKD